MDSCDNLYSRFVAKSFTDQSLTRKLITPNYSEENVPPASTFYFSEWCEIIQKINSYRKIDSVLEIGVGDGSFIATALEMNLSVDAVEIDEESAQKISDLLDIDIYCSDFLCHETDKKYSALFMGDVIEHMTNPKKALKKAFDLLDSEGILWLSTPNFKSAFSRFNKFKDLMWCVPTHLTYFSYQGLEKIANECGFEISEYTVSAKYNGSMELIMKKKN